jgi:glycosyltransferase involved in cell wall biosynthesis
VKRRPARRVLFAGTFEPTFARNRVLRTLLEDQGYTVEDVQVPLWGKDRFRLVDQSKVKLALRAVRAYASLTVRLLRAGRPDVAFALYPGYFDVPLVRVFARLRKFPLVFDIFISLQDTIAGDRALRSSESLMSKFAGRVDRAACRRADLVLADTPAHASYFAELTGVPRDRFRVLWLGAQDLFRPQPDIIPTRNLVVFHGTFIPLQGLETIVRAAKLVESEGLTVRIIGDGQERSAIEALVRELDATNVELTGLLPLEEIPRQIASASLCLGIFGTTLKAGRVVPNKLYECLAVGRPVLTGDTPAIRDAFDGEVATVPPGDPQALANAIRSLCASPDELADLGRRGLARYERDYSQEALGRTLGTYVEELIGAHDRA